MQVSGENVGCIRKADYPLLHGWLTEGLIDSLSLKLHGGDYRLLFEDEMLEEGNAGFFGLLTVTLHEPEPEKAPAAEDQGTMHYISTTYDTRLREDDGRRGNAALVLALLLGAFYLGFSIPYWLMIRRGLISASAYLGGDLPDSLLCPHLALVAGALAVTLIGFFLKNCFVPLAAALLFLGSAWPLPGFAVCTLPAALLCMIAAFKKKPRGAFTALKTVILLGVLGVGGWFLRDTALYVWNNRAFMLRPTGHEEALTVPSHDSDGTDGLFLDPLDGDDAFDDDGNYDFDDDDFDFDDGDDFDAFDDEDDF